MMVKRKERKKNIQLTGWGPSVIAHLAPDSTPPEDQFSFLSFGPTFCLTEVWDK